MFPATKFSIVAIFPMKIGVDIIKKHVLLETENRRANSRVIVGGD